VDGSQASAIPSRTQGKANPGSSSAKKNSADPVFGVSKHPQFGAPSSFSLSRAGVERQAAFEEQHEVHDLRLA
jgi:hypothetical protein